MARFLLFIAVLAISTGAPLVRLAAPAPALTVAAARICLAAGILALTAPATWRLFIGLGRRERWLIIAGGGLLGLHFGVWITSLYFTSTAASVALVATQPIFAALFARFLGDSISRREIMGMAVAALGCAVLGGGDLISATPGALIGDALALAGAAAAACYLLVGRRMRAALPLTPYLAMVNVVAGLFLLAAALVSGAQFIGFDSHVYVALVLAAVVPSLIGHTLLNWSVRRTPTHLVALAILAEPVGASLLAWGLFAEVPPVHAAAGGAVILAGILIGFAGHGRGAKSENAPADSAPPPGSAG